MAARKRATVFKVGDRVQVGARTGTILERCVDTYGDGNKCDCSPHCHQPYRIQYHNQAKGDGIWSGSGDAELIPEDPKTTTPDLINSPAHYVTPGYAFEVIDAIEAWGLNYRLGAVVKYVARHLRKGEPLKDLRKARWYLDREIAKMEAAKP